MIETKNGRHYVRISHRGRRPSLGACATRAEAEELESAGYVKAAESPHLTLGKWAEDWLDRREVVHKVAHIEADRRNWKKHVVGAPIANVSIEMLDPTHV